MSKKDEKIAMQEQDMSRLNSFISNLKTGRATPHAIAKENFLNKPPKCAFNGTKMPKIIDFSNEPSDEFEESDILSSDNSSGTSKLKKNKNKKIQNKRDYINVIPRKSWKHDNYSLQSEKQNSNKMQIKNTRWTPISRTKSMFLAVIVSLFLILLFE